MELTNADVVAAAAPTPATATGLRLALAASESERLWPQAEAAWAAGNAEVAVWLGFRALPRREEDRKKAPNPARMRLLLGWIAESGIVLREASMLAGELIQWEAKRSPKKARALAKELGAVAINLDGFFAMGYDLVAARNAMTADRDEAKPDSPLFRMGKRGHDDFAERCAAEQAAPFAGLVFPQTTRQELEALVGAARAPEKLREWNLLKGGVSGIFFGPSGTGKTQAVRRIGLQLGRHVHEVSADQVFGRYFGDSEKGARRVFTDYRSAMDLAKTNKEPAPILFIDEAEALLSRRVAVENGSDITHNGVISIFLAEMDRLPPDALLIAACNNVEASFIDPAFYRRLHYKVEFAAPGPQERAQLWQAFAKAMPVDPAIDWSALGRAVGVTGAEIELACRMAGSLALARGLEVVGEELLRDSAARQVSARGDGKGRGIGFGM